VCRGEGKRELFACFFFFCWVMGVDEVLRGGRMGYYIGLMGGRIGLIRLIREIRLIGLIMQLRIDGAH